jgi:hypothetical protein
MLILEFLKDLGNVQGYSRKSKIILFAYYLRQYQAVIEFGAVDIKQCFIDALIKPPSDLNKLLKVLAKGKDSPFMRAKRSGRYSLTLSGLNEVEGLEMGVLFFDILKGRKDLISRNERR